MQHSPSRSPWILALATSSLASFAVAQDEVATAAQERRIEKVDVRFEKPERLKAGGAYVRTASPGYAAPCWHDVDGDGAKDLVVGQFAKGKLMLCRGQADGTLAAPDWIRAAGEIAEVPGVW